MPNPTVQIQARLASTRLPGKVMYPLVGRRVIGRVVDQCTDVDSELRVVLTVGDQPENDALIEWCGRAGITCYQGPEDNLLSRHLSTARVEDSDPIIRVTGDCPFVPSEEIERLIAKHDENDARYTTNFTEEMPIGTAIDVIDRDLLEELSAMGEIHPVKRPRSAPEEWSVSYSVSDRWTLYSDAHIAVDTPSDYWRLTDAVEAVGNESMAVARWLSER